MKFFFLILTILPSFHLFAADIEIKDARIKPTITGMNRTALFMKIINNSNKDIRLTSISGKFAPSFEFHNLEMNNGKMMMHPVESILIRKNSFTELKSGGLHVMVLDAPKPILKTKVYGAKLMFDNKEDVFITIKVKD